MCSHALAHASEEGVTQKMEHSWVRTFRTASITLSSFEHHSHAPARGAYAQQPHQSDAATSLVSILLPMDCTCDPGSSEVGANLLFEDVVDLRLTPAGLRLVIFRRSFRCRAIRETPRGCCTHLRSSTEFILPSGTSAIITADKLSGRTCREAAMFCWLACKAREMLRAHCRSAIMSEYEFQFGFQVDSAGGYEPL